jgi:hypothetical protein
LELELDPEFGLLDKLEALLGYGPQSMSQLDKAWWPGRGFALARQADLERLWSTEVWD